MLQKKASRYGEWEGMAAGGTLSKVYEEGCERGVVHMSGAVGLDDGSSSRGEHGGWSSDRGCVRNTRGKRRRADLCE